MTSRSLNSPIPDPAARIPWGDSNFDLQGAAMQISAELTQLRDSPPDAVRVLQNLFRIAASYRIGLHQRQLSAEEAKKILDSSTDGFVDEVFGLKISAPVPHLHLFAGTGFIHSFDAMYGSGSVNAALLASTEETVQGPNEPTPSLIGPILGGYAHHFTMMPKRHEVRPFEALTGEADVILSTDGLQELLPRIGWLGLTRLILNPEKNYGGKFIGEGSTGKVFRCNIEGLDVAVKVSESVLQPEAIPKGRGFVSFAEVDNRDHFGETQVVVRALRELQLDGMTFRATTEFAAGKDFSVTSFVEGVPFSSLESSAEAPWTAEELQAATDQLAKAKVFFSLFRQTRLWSGKPSLEEYDRCKTHYYLQQSFNREMPEAWVPNPDLDLTNIILERFDPQSRVFHLVIIDQGADWPLPRGDSENHEYHEGLSAWLYLVYSADYFTLQKDRNLKAALERFKVCSPQDFSQGLGSFQGLGHLNCGPPIDAAAFEGPLSRIPEEYIKLIAATITKHLEDKSFIGPLPKLWQQIAAKKGWSVLTEGC
jgi:hypothetical protein